MFCATCGANIAPGAPFCQSCGTPVPVQPVQSAPPHPQSPPPQFVAASAQPGWGAAAAPAAAPGVFAAGYAGWGTRAIGFIIDALLIGIGMGVLYLILGTVLASMAGLFGHRVAGGACCMMLLLFPISTLLVGLYNGVYLIALRGYSIGQGVVKVKVVDANGRLLSQGTAFLRLLVRVGLGFIPFLPALDLLWPLWDVRGQTLHDKAVNAYVVNNPQGF